MTKEFAEHSKKLDTLLAKQDLMATKQDIDKLRTDLSAEFNAKFNSSLRKIERTNLRLDDVIENNRRLTVLRLIGIPAKQNERLEITVNKMFSLVGIDNPPEHDCFRFKSNDGNGSIGIRFSTEWHKNMVFTNYLKVARTMTLEKFTGDASDAKKPCFITHDLCKEQYEINKLAGVLKKQKRIYSSRIVQGYVMIRVREDAAPTRYDSAKILEEAMKKSK